MAAPTIGKPKVPTAAERRAALGGAAAHQQAASTMAGEQLRAVAPEQALVPPAESITATEQVLVPTASPAPLELASHPAGVISDELISDAVVAVESPPPVTAEVSPTVAELQAAPATKAAIVDTHGRRANARKQPAADTPTGMEPERAVKIPESVWKDIKVSLAFLADVNDAPGSIKKYLVEAHRLYDAHLRKQGKLPVK